MAQSVGFKHEQIREYLRSLLGHAAPWSPAPSERALVQRFSVARATVRHAIDTLVTEGLLTRIHGKGTFVAPRSCRSTLILGYSDEMASYGEVNSKTLLLQRLHAGPGVARALNLAEGDAVIHWRRLRYLDGRAVALQDVYLNEVLLPGFSPRVPPTSLYDDLTERGLRPRWAEDAISAGPATITESTALSITDQSPVLRYERRGILSHGDVAALSVTALRPDPIREAAASTRIDFPAVVVVEVSRTVYRADHYTAQFTLSSD